MSAISNHFLAVQAALIGSYPLPVEHVADLIETAKLILVCGNGGSAATAIHFASDLRSLGLPAFDLLSPSKVTQLGNDEGYDFVFSKQAAPIDALVIAFSGSGTSPNIRMLKPLADRLILFTSTMHELDYAPETTLIRVPSADYEVIEDVHLIMCHAIKKELKARRQ